VAMPPPPKAFGELEEKELENKNLSLLII